MHRKNLTQQDNRTFVTLEPTVEDERWLAHVREHIIHQVAHEQEHKQANIAITKTEQAIDKRLEAMNEFRGQIKDQAATFVTKDTFDSYKADAFRRDDELRNLIIEVKATQIVASSKAEGKAIGQGAVVAAIVGLVSFASLLLGFIIVVANILTSN